MRSSSGSPPATAFLAATHGPAVLGTVSLAEKLGPQLGELRSPVNVRELPTSPSSRARQIRKGKKERGAVQRRHQLRDPCISPRLPVLFLSVLVDFQRTLLRQLDFPRVRRQCLALFSQVRHRSIRQPSTAIRDIAHHVVRLRQWWLRPKQFDQHVWRIWKQHKYKHRYVQNQFAFWLFLSFL